MTLGCQLQTGGVTPQKQGTALKDGLGGRQPADFGTGA